MKHEWRPVLHVYNYSIIMVLDFLLYFNNKLIIVSVGIATLRMVNS